ncbi:MAG: hypothetical protein M3N54_16175 [Acidobacteriota bacterium]|nr:hypothetical protein [Acidobacteriota bacterium]
MLEISAIRVWKEVGYPFQIHYSAAVAEQIRQFAIDGLLALPRVGLGVGGLLIGTREGDRITIAGSAPIPCSHAMGPAFLLTREEADAALRDSQELSVVGCYLSKTGRVLDLNQTDLSFYRSFCPQQWQIMLRVRPSTVEETLATLFFRGSSGMVVYGPERLLRMGTPPEPEPEPEAEQPPDEPAENPTPEVAEAATVADAQPEVEPVKKISGRTVAVLVISALLIGGAVELLLQLR